MAIMMCDPRQGGCGCIRDLSDPAKCPECGQGCLLPLTPETVKELIGTLSEEAKEKLREGLREILNQQLRDFHLSKEQLERFGRAIFGDEGPGETAD